jgi:hypothetical protein
MLRTEFCNYYSDEFLASKGYTSSIWETCICRHAPAFLSVLCRHRDVVKFLSASFFRSALGRLQWKRTISRHNILSVKNFAADSASPPTSVITIYFKDLFIYSWTGLVWIDSDQWSALVNTVLNFRVPYNVGKFLSSWATGGFSRRTQFHGVIYLFIYFWFIYDAYSCYDCIVWNGGMISK